ncbi:nuclear pore complex protein NUP93B-like [Humulus lupulus]|uniref:nuclear pore complex protein NUP93B-like n=1 Tax=Humulus lupulus TaxID=3486 RepID=UPI002B415DAC|nr:nuclear pore complex protein NUP93B-like [Humulus lupulus]
MAIISAVQEAQKDNLRSFNDYMLKVLEIVSMTSSPQASSGASSMQLVPLANKPVLEKKAAVYAEVVKNLNDARERGLPFKPATAFKGAYESLGLDASGGKSVHFQKIWYLIQFLSHV